MLGFLKWVGIVFSAVVLLVVAFFVAMRFHDGPMEIISGGPFRTGGLTAAPADWSFAADLQTIEFQTLEPKTSRTVWLAVHDGRLFLISGYMTTGYGKIWKQWPHYIESNDRVILRIDGKLYEQRLERITAGPEVTPVMAEFGRKYGVPGAPEGVTSGAAWLYEVKPRA